MLTWGPFEPPVTGGVNDGGWGGVGGVLTLALFITGGRAGATGGMGIGPPDDINANSWRGPGDPIYC